MTLGSLGLAVLVMGLSCLLTRWLCSPAAPLALLDHPNDRSLHTAPTPRTGGLAIVASIVVGLLLVEATGWADVTFFMSAHPTRSGVWFWVMGSTLALSAVSFWDDRAGLSPAIRFILHGLAATGVVWGACLTVAAVSVPILGSFSLEWLAPSLTVLGLMWVANLYNFMDGMDGFAGGMTVLGFGMLGYLAWIGGSQELALLALLISAAAAGFLFFNLPPARVFMGDVGSVPLGFLAGTLAVLGVHDGVFDLWAPLLIFSPFIVDATVTLLRRLSRGVKVWQAHREHYYQRLVLAGWSHRKTVLAEYVLMLACGTTAVLYVHVIELFRLAILLMWVVVYAALAWSVRSVELKLESRRVAA